MPSFEQLAQESLLCAKVWRRFAERPDSSASLRDNATKLSGLFYHQHVVFTLMAEAEKEGQAS